MRVVVVGAGGMGGYFGGMLARGGADVSFVARGAHLKAMQTQGLKVKSQLFGEFTLSVRATADPARIGPVDLVLFCVKAYDLEPAALQCRPLVGAQTAVVPVQNGIDIAERLERILGGGRILGGLTYVAGYIESPGVVVQQGRSGELIFGELQGGTSERTSRLLAFFRSAGLPAELCPDIRRKLWEKFIVVCATGGVLALTRLPFGPVFASAETSGLMKGVMEEVARLARAGGVGLPEGIVDRLFEELKGKMAPQAKSSQLRDLEEGRRLELEFLNGTAVRLGKERGVPTPLNFAVYAALTPYRDGPPEIR